MVCCVVRYPEALASWRRRNTHYRRWLVLQLLGIATLPVSGRHCYSSRFPISIGPSTRTHTRPEGTKTRVLGLDDDLDIYRLRPLVSQIEPLRCPRLRKETRTADFLATHRCSIDFP